MRPVRNRPISIIDGAAKLQDVSVAALKVSDLVLLPVRPSGADLWAVEDLVEIIKTRQEITARAPAAAFVVSQQIVGTNLAGEIADVLRRYGLPVLEGHTSQRIVYAEALTGGTTVLDMEPRGRPPARSSALQKKF